MKKRVLSVLLAFALLLTVWPSYAMAYEKADSENPPSDNVLGVLPERAEEPDGTVNDIFYYRFVPDEFPVISSVAVTDPETFSGTTYQDQLDEASKAIYDELIKQLGDGTQTTATFTDANVTKYLTSNPISYYKYEVTDGTYAYDEIVATDGKTYTTGTSEEHSSWLYPLVASAYLAITNDRPDLPWMRSRGYGFSSSISGTNPQGTVEKTETIMDSEGKSYTYTVTRYENVTITVKSMSLNGVPNFGTNPQTTFTDAVNTAVSAVNTRLGKEANADPSTVASDVSRYELVKAIHDHVCNLLEYDLNTEIQGAFNQTAFSGLVSPHKTVCAGYAKSFKVLCDKYNIPCVLVSGMSTSSAGGQGPHEWAYVQMEDSAWYGVDCTWDDQQKSVPGDAGIYTDYLLIGSETVATHFGNVAFSTSHQPDGEWAPYTVFPYPELSTKMYEDESDLTIEISAKDGDSEITGFNLPESGGVKTITLTSVRADDKTALASQNIKWIVSPSGDGITLASETGNPVQLNVSNKAIGHFQSDQKTLNITVTATYGTKKAESVLTVNARDRYAESIQIVDKNGNAIANNSDSVLQGKELNYKAKVLDQYGAEMPNPTVSWAVSEASETGLATSKGNGVIETAADKAGTFTVTASTAGQNGNNISSTPITVTVSSKPTHELTVNPREITLTYGGTGAIKASSGTGTPEFTSKDTSIVTVDSNGNLKAVGVGETTVEVKVSGTTTHNEKVINVDVTVEAKSLKDSTITATVNPEKMPYTGSQRIPTITVTDSGNTVDSTSQYSVAYSTTGGSAPTDAGTYTVTISATEGSNYKDSIEKTFTVEQAEPTIGTVSVSGQIYTTTTPDAVTLSKTGDAAGTFKITGPAAFTEGSNTINWTFTPNDTKNYKTVTGTVTVNVKARTATGISLAASSNLTKKEYTYGEKFDPTGLIVVVTYDNSDTEEIALPNDQITFNDDLGDASDTAKTVTLTYKGTNLTYDVIGITVNKKQLDITGLSWAVRNYTYDGTERSVVLSGVVPAGLKVTLTGDKATDAGKYTASAEFALAEGYTETNYKIKGTSPITANWEIEAATPAGSDVTLTMNLNDVKERTVTLNDFKIPVEGTFSANASETATTDSLAAGYPKFETDGIKIKLAEDLDDTATAITIPVTFTPTNANYTAIDLELNINLTSNKIPVLEVEAFKKAYDGEAVTIEDLTASAVDSEDENIVLKGEWSLSDTPVAKGAGTYSIPVKFVPSDEEYETVESIASIIIERAKVTIKADDQNMLVDGAYPTLTYTVVDEIAGELFDENVAPTVDCPTYQNVKGTYPITITGPAISKDNNYDIRYEEGTLTVSEKVLEKAATPTATPAAGEVTSGTAVTLACGTEGAKIYYTTDGSTPTSSSTEYTTPIAITAATTIKAIAVKDGMADSEVLTASYTIKTPTVDPGPDEPTPPDEPDPPVVETVAAPAANPNGGSFYGSQTVTLTCATEGAEIYYTTDGTAPSASSTRYTAPFTVTATTTVKAIAVKEGMNDSAELSVTFTRLTSSGGGSGRPSGGGSDRPSGGSSTTPSKPSTPVPDVTTSNRTETTTATPEATVNNGAAQVTIPKEMASEIVNQAAESGSSTVVIAPEFNGDVTSAEVTIPASTVSGIAGQTSADLKVETPVANVTIPNSALSDLGGDVTVSAGRSGEAFEVSVKADGEQLDRISGGIKAEIAVECGPGTVAMLVDADGNVISTVRKSSGDGQTMTVPLDGSARVIFADNSKSFADVPATNWASDAVAFASSHELMNGVSDSDFNPSAPMTRGMLAMVLHNLESNPSAAYAGGFTDVTDGAWYSEAVQWAADQGIINGVSAGVFAPDSSITREQLVVMLYRYVGQPSASGGAMDRFSDSGDVSGWASDAMNWAVANGILNGSNGALNPQGSATRAEVAQMLMNFVSSGVL